MFIPRRRDRCLRWFFWWR